MLSDSMAERLQTRNRDLIQLYSANTPNGMKVAACLEELVELRRTTDGFDYEPHTVNLHAGESRMKDFVDCLNPNGKIPAILDPHGPDHQPITIFESGAILMYLGDKYHELLPVHDSILRAQTIQWLFWGSTGFSSQCKLFGFYYKYCKHKLDYCVERYSKETHRLLGVLDQHLRKHGKHWVVGDRFTIADLAIWPWVYALHENYDDAQQVVFNNFKDYPSVKHWYTRCLARPASQRCLDVTRLF